MNPLIGLESSQDWDEIFNASVASELAYSERDIVQDKLEQIRQMQEQEQQADQNNHHVKPEKNNACIVQLQEVRKCQTRTDPLANPHSQNQLPVVDSQEYVVATAGGESEDTIYVAFKGSDTIHDWYANFTISSTTATNYAADRSYLRRSRGFPLPLICEMLSDNKKVVLCGHSLGGAIATLVTTQLLAVLLDERFEAVASQPERAWPRRLVAALRAKPVVQPPALRCITFGTPLQKLGVLQNPRFADYFLHFVNAKDIVPVLSYGTLSTVLPRVLPTSSFSTALFKTLFDPGSLFKARNNTNESNSNDQNTNQEPNEQTAPNRRSLNGIGGSGNDNDNDNGSSNSSGSGNSSGSDSGNGSGSELSGQVGEANRQVATEGNIAGPVQKEGDRLKPQKMAVPTVAHIRDRINDHIRSQLANQKVKTTNHSLPAQLIESNWGTVCKVYSPPFPQNNNSTPFKPSPIIYHEITEYQRCIISTRPSHPPNPLPLPTPITNLTTHLTSPSSSFTFLNPFSSPQTPLTPLSLFSFTPTIPRAYLRVMPPNHVALDVHVGGVRAGYVGAVLVGDQLCVFTGDYCKGRAVFRLPKPRMLCEETKVQVNSLFGEQGSVMKKTNNQKDEKKTNEDNRHQIEGVAKFALAICNHPFRPVCALSPNPLYFAATFPKDDQGFVSSVCACIGTRRVPLLMTGPQHFRVAITAVVDLLEDPSKAVTLEVVCAQLDCTFLFHIPWTSIKLINRSRM